MILHICQLKRLVDDNDHLLAALINVGTPQDTGIDLHVIGGGHLVTSPDDHEADVGARELADAGHQSADTIGGMEGGIGGMEGWKAGTINTMMVSGTW